MNVLIYLKNTWLKIGRLGEEKYQGNDEVKQNALINWAVAILVFSISFTLLCSVVFYAFIYFEIVAFDIKILPQLGKGYFPAELGTIFLLVLILKLKHYFSGKVIFEIVAIFSYQIYLLVMTIMLGPKSGFHYFIFLFLATPLLLDMKSLWAKIFTEIAILVFIGITFYIVSTFPPLLPLPDEISKVISMLIKPMVLLYTVFYISILLWYFEYSEKLINLWKNLSLLGDEKYTSTENKKDNRLSNQISIISIGITALVVLSNFALTIANAVIAQKNWSYVFFFPALATLLTFILVLLFKLRVKSGSSLRYEILQYFSLLVYISIFSITVGRDSGYHIISTAFVAMPFFFSKASWRLKISFACLAPINSFILYWVTYLITPSFPLTFEINKILYNIIIAYFGFVVVVSFVYIWRKYEFTPKLVKLWRQLSEMGSEHFTSSSLRKSNILTNQIALFFTSQILLLLIVVIFVANYLTDLDAIKYKYYFSYFFTIGILLLAVVQGCLYLKIKTGKLYYSYIQYFSGVIFAFVMVLSLGINSGFHYYMFVMALIPLFALPKDYKIVIFSAVLFDFLLLIILHWWDNHYYPFFPIPNDLSAILNYILLGNAILAITIMSYYLWNETNIAEKAILQERQKAENLLLNILPKQVANELKEKGQARPIAYDFATVLFTDFSGFTRITQSMVATEMVAELDRCFSHFDTLMARYGVEKLKTIGDSFMAAGGIPSQNKSHPIDCVLAGLEIQAFISQIKEYKAEQNEPYWEIKVGINSGPLVAGVVGEKKYAYDVWGDSVNLAARMLSSCQNGKVNISISTYNAIKDYFDCEYRGKVQAKNKGKIDMYFVNGFKEEFCENNNIRLPNQKFREIYEKIKAGDA